MKTRLAWLASAALLSQTAFAYDAVLVDDTTLTTGVAAATAGSAQSLSVKAGSTTLLKFDLSTLPPLATGSNVSSATLTVFVKKTKVAGAISLQVPGGSWSETAIPSVTCSPLPGSDVVSLPLGENATFVRFDVTDLVKQWIDGTADNNGIAIAPDPSGAGIALSIDSKESKTTSHIANLAIELTIGGEQGPAGPTGPQGPKGDPGATGATGATGPATSLSIGTVVSGTSPSVTVTGTAPSQVLNFTIPNAERTGANTAMGNASMPTSTTGTDNTAYGYRALASNTTGAGNTAIGASAMDVSTKANDNTAVGRNALGSGTNSNCNVAVGSQALAGMLVGGWNVAVGYTALTSSTNAADNVAVGNFAMSYNRGARNTALGSHTIEGSGTGGSNVAAGYYALQANSSGDYNVAIGVNCLTSNTSGNYNTAVGAMAMEASESGEYNTALGNNALLSNTSGWNNVAIGRDALKNNLVGSTNIALGANAGQYVTQDNTIMIGNSGTSSDNRLIRIGQSPTHTKAYIAGIRSVTTGVNDAVNVVIDSNGQLGTVSSSERYKEDINSMGNASARLLALRPVTFRYKQPYDNGEKPIQFGLIAEEVAKTFPELAVINADGKPETVKYQELSVLLLNEFQKEHQRVEEQAKTIADQQAQIRALTAHMAAITQKIEKVAQRLDGQDYQPVVNQARGDSAQ